MGHRKYETLLQRLFPHKCVLVHILVINQFLSPCESVTVSTALASDIMLSLIVVIIIVIIIRKYLITRQVCQESRVEQPTALMDWGVAA